MTTIPPGTVFKVVDGLTEVQPTANQLEPLCLPISSSPPENWAMPQQTGDTLELEVDPEDL